MDHVMQTLPNNQAGIGRHKCPYCAYERGYKQAMLDVTEWAQRQSTRQTPATLL